MEEYYQNLEHYDKEASASSKPINLELFFPTRVASPVYTGRPIKGEDGGNESIIKCMLVDSQTRQQVIDWRVAALNVKLVLIRGDFCGISWTPMEFNNNIVASWKNKKNLLLGDLSLLVKDGSGTVANNVRIKHDRNSLKNTTFRLGAMVDNHDCPYRIKEAITNVFEVKDQRQEPKDVRPLLPEDWVWRLNNISKHGPIHKRLDEQGIKTVMDFLDMHDSTPKALEKIYGSKGKKLEDAIVHAKTSRFNNNLHCNAYGRIGITLQQSEPPFDCDYYSGNNCYKRQDMIEDDTFSYTDVDICTCGLCVLALSSSNDGYGPGSGHGYMAAKKRWKKLRATIWFWMVGFKKKVRSCVVAT